MGRELEAEIEKATSEKNISEKWGVIMDICDRIGTSSAGAKESLKIIIKRLNNGDPHVIMQAITLLDACVNNCGKNFHLEIASRDFETEYRKLITKNQGTVAAKLKSCLKAWAESPDFRTDAQLNLIPSLYNKLRNEGQDFTDLQPEKKRTVQAIPKDPNVVSSQQEEDDIAKAIELSLKEKTGSPKAASNYTITSIYPTASLSNPLLNTTALSAEPRKVRALYDFEAAEDNELTFKAGDIILVLEDSDPNWWKGQNKQGDGLFPSNFVTADLSVEPESVPVAGGATKKSVQFQEEQQDLKEQTPEINEDSIDRLLYLLHEADPSDHTQDSNEMIRLEQVVNQMSPLIDTELERVDRKHAQLTQLSSDLVDAINLYHSLMRDSDRPMSGGFPMGFPPGQMAYAGAGPISLPPMYGNQMFHHGMMPGMQQQYPAGFGPPHLDNMQNMQSMPNMQNGHAPQFIPQQGGFPSQMIPPQTVSQMAPPPQQQPIQMQQPQLNVQGQHFPNQQLPSDPPNGMQPSFPAQPQNMSHMNHMMSNLQMNTQPLGMMQNHPMTFIQQTDSNQNIPLYQQQQR